MLQKMLTFLPFDRRFAYPGVVNEIRLFLSPRDQSALADRFMARSAEKPNITYEKIK